MRAPGKKEARAASLENTRAVKPCLTKHPFQNIRESPYHRKICIKWIISIYYKTNIKNTNLVNSEYDSSLL